MTIQPDSMAFSLESPVATLVLVNIRRLNLAAAQGLQRMAASGILPGCHKALAFARNIGWHVAFVNDPESGTEGPPYQRWLRGFEPGRMDAVFVRRTASCYSSSYFSEAISSEGGALIIVGYLGDGGCLATGADALLAGHRITYLSDAVLDSLTDHLIGNEAIRLIRTFTGFDLQVIVTADLPVSMATNSGVTNETVYPSLHKKLNRL